MNYLKLKKINKLYFSYRDISKAFNINPESAKVTIARYVKAGYIKRLKKNYYILRETWDILSTEDRFKIANVVQVPSYISLTTALSYYGYTTQVQQAYYESVVFRRTKEMKIGDVVFKYVKLKKSLYTGFLKEKGIFIASPEKALLDSLYLMAQNKYTLDLSAIDRHKFNKALLDKYMKMYPAGIRSAMVSLWKI